MRGADNKVLDAEPPIASFMKSMLIGGGSVNAIVMFRRRGSTWPDEQSSQTMVVELMPGYSGKSLAAKLGIQGDEPWYVWDAPDDYESWLGELPAGARLIRNRLPANCHHVHAFVMSRKKLQSQLQRVLKKIAPDGMLWVSWPKKSSKIVTDVTEDVIREVALESVWVDVKVCAVSEVWSGLKLVIRREFRS